MTLYAARIPMLRGFYASEVFAAGEDRDDAIQNLIRVYDAHVATEVDAEWVPHPFSPEYLTPDDEGYEEHAAKLRQTFINQVKTYLTEIDEGALLLIRS